MTVTALKASPKVSSRPRQAPPPPVQAVPPAPPAAPSRRRGFTPLTPMRVQAAKSMTKLADHMKETHPDMLAHQHVRDAARMLRSGNEEAAQRHLRAAMFAMTPQSLMRNGLHTDDDHIAARDAMHGIHRHLLLTKDIADTAAKNQAAIRRDSYGDDSSSPPMPQPPVHADPNAGYGPGALAQKPTARQPPGDQALNAPNRAGTGKPDPNVADPAGPQPKGSKQFSYGWGDLSAVIELVTRPKVVDLVGPHGYIHGWIFVGGPGLPSVASHNAKLKAKGITPPTKAHPALTREPPSVKAKAAAPGPAVKAPAVKSAPAAKAAPKPAQAPAVKQEAAPAPAVKAPPVPAAKAAGAKVLEAPAAKLPAAGDPSAVKQVDEMSTLASLGGKSTQKAVLKKKSLADLHAMDAEYTRRGAASGKVAGAHQLVKDEIASRGATPLPAQSPDEIKAAHAAAAGAVKAAAAGPSTKEDLVAAWSTSYRYKGTTESKNKRTADFAKEMHRLLSTNKQPTTCGPGCQDAHKFLTMVDHDATPQPKQLQRGLTLSSSAAERMFKPGKTMDMPVASWTSDPDMAAKYAKGEGKQAAGKTKVVLYTAPGAKGLDITAMSAWENEHEVVTGGRYSVDKVQNDGGVMHVYLSQKDFSAH